MVAKDNTLEVGQSRVGLMVDGLPETPRVSVKLERTDRRVEVTIPFLDGISDIYHYWFSSDTMYGDDPDRTRRRYEPPDVISFYDAHGPVGLVGSRASGSSMNVGGTGVGEGRIIFDYTILGASSGAVYESINGLRSEVEGLGTWIGIRSLNAEQKFKDAGRLDSVNLRLPSSPEIRVARRLNAEFQSNWRYGPGPGPDQTTEAPAKLDALDFLFAFGDLGSKGVGRWIDLSHKFERGLSPLVGLLDLEGASLEAHLAQVGIGFETLGYDLIIASGVSKSQADKKSWEDRVRAVTSVTASVLPFSEDDFIDLLRRTYRAVKHADNARPDWQEMHLAYRQSIQVFRAWVAIRLGVPKKGLKAALDHDKATRHIREIQRVIGQSDLQGGAAS